MEAARAAQGEDTEDTEDREDIEDEFETGMNGPKEKVDAGYPAQDESTLINLE